MIGWYEMVLTPSITKILFASTEIEPDEIIDLLKSEIRLKEVCQKVLYRRLIAKNAEEREVIITPEEIQIEADRQRYQRRIESAAATYTWLSEQLITSDDWESGIYHQLLTRKLAAHLFTNEVGKYFSEHRLDFERVLLYRLRISSAQLAQELFYQIEEGEISFYEAAHLYDVDEKRRLQCGYEGRLYRWSLNPAMAAIVFGAPLEAVLGPFEHEHQYDLLMVENLMSAELTSEIQEEILERLFREWLEGEFNYFIHNHV
jgi:parvulin-like peptidyl-prolyl isomerase